MKVVVGLLLGFWVVSAQAHEALSGWTYPPECCGNGDCHEVEGATVEATPQGYFIPANGDTVTYRGDSRLKPSPDGRYHICTRGGTPDGYTYCLFVPSGS